VTMIEGAAKKTVAVDTGNLRRSITHEVTASGGFIVGRVGTNVPYAKVVEEGRAAGSAMPPPGVLLGWMRRKGIPVDEMFIGRNDVGDITGSAKVGGGYHGIEYLIARAIGKRGIKARPYLKPALQNNMAAINREFGGLPARIMKRLTRP
jgi:phage gpG-like protein